MFTRLSVSVVHHIRVHGLHFALLILVGQECLSRGSAVLSGETIAQDELSAALGAVGISSLHNAGVISGTLLANVGQSQVSIGQVLTIHKTGLQVSAAIHHSAGSNELNLVRTGNLVGRNSSHNGSLVAEAAFTVTSEAT